MYCDVHKGLLTSRQKCEYELCRSKEDIAADPLQLDSKEGCLPKGCEGEDNEIECIRGICGQ